MICPCCGSEVDKPDPEQLLDFYMFPRLMRRAVGYLAQPRRFGRWVEYNHLVAHVYAEHVDGGPLTAKNSIHVRVHELLPRFKKTAFVLERGGKGRNGQGIRLRWRTPEDA